MSPSFQAGHALLIGAGADLPFTIDDARGIADILKDPERCSYPPGQVELLVGEAAHRQAVLDALDRLAEKADESSTVVIYFSGHGYHASTPTSEAYFLIPFGVQMEHLLDTAISGSEFAARLQAIRSRKLLLLLDCCHAGGVGLAKGLELAKSPLPPEALQILENGKGRVIIASCKDSELSYGGRPYSAFTLALIEAFSGQGASRQDGFVRVADLAMYTREKVPGRTKERQHPILQFEEADNFVLAYYAGGETEPKGLPFAQEPEIEPEPGAWNGVFDQRGQTVHGPQTNIAGNVQGPVFSGQFSGPVALGGEAVDMSGSTAPMYKPTIIQQTEKFPVPHQIPSPPKNFTGREELIDQILSGFAQGDTIIGLRGMGGLGKTALAYKLAERLRDRYKDGQLMVNLQGTATNPLTPSQAMSKLLRYYYPAAPLPESQEELQSLYLSTLDGKCAMVLLDNALDDPQVMPLLPPSTCGMIITSRRKLALSDVFPIDLEVLKLEEATELLAKTARPHSPNLLPQEAPLWKEIAGMCGCLPVALKAAGSYLACTPGSSPKQYIKELQDERKRLGIIGKEGVEEDLVTKFSLSYSRLASETAQVFRLLSIFPADFDAQAEEVVCQDEGHCHLIDLTRWSLVEYQSLDTEGEGRYHLHDLVRLFAAGRLEEEGGEAARNDAQQRHAEYFRDVLSSATKLYKNGDALVGLRRFDLERMNIESAWAWVKRNLESNNIVASLCNSFLNRPYLLELRMHPREWISWLEPALASARQLKDKSMEGVHLANLGVAYENLGETRKAIDYYELALAIVREIGDRRVEGNALGNLGDAYVTLGETRKAIDYCEQALAIAREIGNRRGEGNVLGNLGDAYVTLGETRKAIDYYEQRLAITREIRERRGEGYTLGNLGNAYADLGDAKKAIEYYEQALAIARQISDRRNEGVWLGNLGLAYANLGNDCSATECYEQALTKAREIGDRRGEGNALWNMSLAHDKLGRRAQAIECAKAALKIREVIEDPRAEKIRRKLQEWGK